ncbi:MAG: DUF3565 domain-containing protein [Acidimicrobiales bacterium]
MVLRFAQDDVGDWVAELDCLHRQHVRHDPPFWSAPWVLDTLARTRRVGTPFDCVLCDRLELPTDLQVVRVTDTWDELTTPAGLRRAHRVAAGTWGRMRIEAGRVRFRAQTSPPVDVVLAAGASQPIPPGVEHEVEPLGPVRFRVEFLGPVEDPIA